MKAFLSSENSTETDAKLLPMLYCVALVIFFDPSRAWNQSEIRTTIGLEFQKNLLKDAKVFKLKA